MNEIKPIETTYNGYRFRSRLEARWAVFFDAFCIMYEYEPEGFMLKYGMRYLPDFALYNVHWRGEHAEHYLEKRTQPIYVEVKGVNKYDEIRLDERVRMEEFAKHAPLIILGNIPLDDFSAQDSCSGLCSFSLLDGDNYPGFFTVFNNEIWFSGADHNEFSCGSADKALSIARQARFEYGETPVNFAKYF